MMASPIIAPSSRVRRRRLRSDARSRRRRRSCCCGSSRRSVAYWLSVPVGPRVRPLNDDERALLRRTARKTWRYFETFVTAAERWLPPDNYQEDGEAPKLARRTSPTNIGMSLLSTLAAHDLGYLTTDALVDAARPHADHARRPGAPQRPFPELVRHRRPWRRSIRATSRPSTAAISPARSSRSRRGSSALLDHTADAATQRLDGLDRRRRILLARQPPTRPATVERVRPSTAVNRLARDIVARSAMRSYAAGHGSRLELLADRAWRTRRPASTGRPRALEHARATSSSGRAPSSRPCAALEGAANHFDGDGAATRSPGVRRRSPTTCASTFSTTGGAASSRSATGSPDADGPGAARQLVLRSAGVGGAARELRRHRQGRRAAAPLVPPRAPGHERQRPRDADVVGRHDVRVPDAAAADAGVSGNAAGSELPRRGPAADRIRTRARRAVGHLGVGLRVHRSRRATISTGRSACRASASGAAWPTSSSSRRTPPRSRASSIRPRQRQTSERLAREGLDGRFGFYEAIDYRPRRRSTPEATAPTGETPPAHRARVLRAPPGHVARRAGQRGLRRRLRRRGSTPIRACRPPNCCCRSACRGKPSCRSRGRRKARRCRRRCPVLASRRFSRRTRRARTRSSCRTAATPRR